MSFIWFSYVVIVINPISAMMLLIIVIYYEHTIKLGPFIRFILGCVVLYMGYRVAEHINFIQDYQEPRTKSWVILYILQHALIWKLFFRYMIKKKLYRRNDA